MDTISKTRVQRFPSKRFAEHVGLKNLHTEWNLPPKSTPNSIGIICDRWCLSPEGSEVEHEAEVKMVTIYLKILELNPPIKVINASTVRNVYDIVMGIVSKFTIDDIKFFMNLSREELVTYNMSNRKRSESIESICGMHAGWVCNPETMIKIEKHLGLI